VHVIKFMYRNIFSIVLSLLIKSIFNFLSYFADKKYILTLICLIAALNSPNSNTLNFTEFRQFCFQNRLRQVSGWSHSQFIFQHDRINTQRLKVFFSCRISALLLLSHFGPVQHRSMSFLASYHRGINEIWHWQMNVKTELKKWNRS